MTVWILVLVVWLAGIPAALFVLSELSRQVRMRRRSRVTGTLASTIEFPVTRRR